jgi:hypothetical protein
LAWLASADQKLENTQDRNIFSVYPHFCNEPLILVDRKPITNYIANKGNLQQRLLLMKKML